MAEDKEKLSDVSERISGLSPEKQALLARLLKQKRAEKAKPETISKRQDQSIYPLSHAQRRMWFLSQWEPDSPFYNIASVVRLQGNLNVQALQASFNEILRRHEVLRAHFITEAGQPVQVIDPEMQLDLEVIDISKDVGLEGIKSERFRSLASKEANWSFDLVHGPLVHAGLVKLGSDDHVLFLTFHHIISDGWSISVFIREAALLYGAFSNGQSLEISGENPVLPESPIQYADYAAWQNEWLQGEILQNQLSYWKEKLGGTDVFLELPTDRPRPTFQSFNGDTYQFELSRQLSEALRKLAKKYDVTMFMLLLAAFEALLYRYSGQEDIRVGTPIANRNRAELEGLIGLFVNTLVMRGELSDNLSFADFVSQIRETALGAYAHQDLPLEMLLDELNVVRDMSRTPLYQVMFTVQDTPLRSLDIPGAKFSILESESGTAKFDLTLFMEDHGSEAGNQQTISGAVEYNRDLFNQSTIVSMMDSLQVFLEGIVKDPNQLISQLPLLSGAERQKILFEWNDTFQDYPFETGLAALFEEQVLRAPDKIAIRFPKGDLAKDLDEALTYGELNQQANRLAHYLQGLGIGPGKLVGIYMERSLRMVVATLAIIKADGAYLPLDLSYPPERLAFMLEDSQAPVLLTTSAFIKSLEQVISDPAKTENGFDVICLDQEPFLSRISAHSNENPVNKRLYPTETNGHDLAYVMYTSGSTGKPKGVAIPQHAITRLVINTNYIHIGPADRVAHASNPSFDAATFEIWGALLNGAELIGVTRETALSAKSYAAYITDTQINTLFITTALFNHLAHEVPAALTQVKNLLFGGEAADPSAIRSVLQVGKPVHFLNAYGPTESTTFATWYEIDDLPPTATNVPIGRPVANTQTYVLDKFNNPVPVGVPGELYLGGDGLAQGYLNRPDLTTEKFIHNPYQLELSAFASRRHPHLTQPMPVDDRLYKTGDRVRYLPGGEIEFLGRFDFQVKLRGLRIEIGEIEVAIGQFPSIQSNAVLLREDTPGDKRLVAYLVAKPERTINLVELRKFLKDSLPDFMIPVAFVILEAMPITPNGKLERSALPVPDQSRPDMGKAYVPPTTSVEKYLVSRWQDILGLDRIGIYDDFFELGGDSLKAAILMNRLQEELGGATHVRALFMAPTVADLNLYMNEYYPQGVEKINAQFGQPGKTESQTTPAERSSADGANTGIIGKTGLIGQEQVRGTVDAAKIDLMRKIIKPLPQRQMITSIKMNPPAVFVISPPRSGSTLLRTMMAGNPHLFSPPELDLLSFNTLAERRAAFSGPYAFWLEGVERAIMELKGCDADQARRIMQNFENEGITTQQFYGIFQSWISEAATNDPKNPGGRSLLVDKTPVYALDLEILKRAEEDFDQPYYIHLVRHPFASIYSFIEAKLDGVFFRYDHPFTQRELAELVWIVSHQNILDFLADIPQERQMRITFEDMVKQPADEMERICEFLDLPFYSGMLKPYEGDRMTSGVREGAQMVGDFKFYLRKDIDPKAADRWKKFHVDDFLSPQGWGIAEKLGYERPMEQHRAETELTEITPVSRSGELPLSFAQQRLWFLDQWEPGSPYYNVPAAVRLHGRLNLPAMRQTLNEILRRHEVLRTRFTLQDGKPHLVVDEPGIEMHRHEMPVLLIDLQHLPEAERETEAQRLAIEEARRPFDLSKGPLIRGTLIQLDKEDCIVALTMHHIVSDGWSAGVIIREIGTLYSAFSEGKPSPLPELAIQYVDYASWQRQWLQGPVMEEQLSYWRNKLANIPAMLELPADRPRPAVQTQRGARRLFEFPNELFAGLKKLSQKSETTLFMTLLAAFQALLFRYSGQEDICVGTPIANRTRAEIAPLIGFFVNTLVLRGDLSQNPTFRDLLAQVKQTAIEAYGHQDIPFERLVDELQPGRDQSHTPLFQVMFTLQESSIQSLKLPGITLTPVQLDSGTAKFDLILTMVDRGDILKGVLEYNTDLFNLSTIDRMIEHYRTLLEAVTADPDQNIATIDILTPAERQQLLVDWNRTFDPLTEDVLTQTIDKLFEVQALARGSQTAVVYRDQSMTFDDLNRRSNQLAGYLRQLGVGPDVIVGLAVERSLDMIVGIFGILKAGGAYLPLDPEYPQDRIAFILNDANVKVLLTQDHLKQELSGLITNRETDPSVHLICFDSDWHEISQYPVPQPILDIEEPVLDISHRLAYVIYTSGSTGRPKGVLIEHRSAINLWLGLNRVIYANHRTDLDRPLRVSLNAPLPFDASVQEWLMLLSGHTLVIIPADVRQDAEYLLGYIQQQKIDVLDCVPSQLKMLISAGLFTSDGWVPQAVLPGGEAIDPKTWELLAENESTEFYNMYGPTECTVDSTICQASAHPLQPSIGRPIVNAQAYIFDQHMQIVPIGVPGELYLGGGGVGRGYLNRPDLTTERFVQNPFIEYQKQSGLEMPSGDRLYKTGDLVRYLPDGYLEYIGRADFQVKLRGFRIELGEIESVLMQTPGIKEAVVIVREDTPGEKQLVAYIILDGSLDSEMNISALRNQLKSKLPEYMVPGVFVTLESLPLTPNRKVDRKALPKPGGLRPELEAVYTAPRNEREKLLADIWQQVLKVDRVGIQDNFFDLGGDSILSIQVVSRANQAGIRLTPRQIFEAQTIEALAQVAGTAPAIVAEQGLVTGPVELTPIQHSFFENNLSNPNHWNQAMLLEVRRPLKMDVLKDAVQHLVRQHDALRFRFKQGGRTSSDDDGWEQISEGMDIPGFDPTVAERSEIPISYVDLSNVAADDWGDMIEEQATLAQGSLDIRHGPLMKIVYFNLLSDSPPAKGESATGYAESGTVFKGRSPGRLLVVLHHLVVDGISWRILLQDLLTAYEQASQGVPVQLPLKTTSYQTWAARLKEYVQQPEIQDQMAFWLANSQKARVLGINQIPVDRSRHENLEDATDHVRASLDEQETDNLLHNVNSAYNTDTNDILLTALALTFKKSFGLVGIRVTLEGHGREDILENVDITRTVGWFTSLYPLNLIVNAKADPGENLMAIKEQIRQVPQKGIGYGLLRYLDPAGEALKSEPIGQISFNYLGQVDQVLPEDAPFRVAGESTGPSHDPANPRQFLIDVVASVIHHKLRVEWVYNQNFHRRETIENLSNTFMEQIKQLIAHCTSASGTGYTPSDFPDVELSPDEIEGLMEELSEGEE